MRACACTNRPAALHAPLYAGTQSAKCLPLPPCTRTLLSFSAALNQVFRDKSPKEIAAFGMLVSSTLKDVVALGSGVDPVLRSKLTDMTDDIEAVGRDVEERQRDKQEREAEQA